MKLKGASGIGESLVLLGAFAGMEGVRAGCAEDGESPTMDVDNVGVIRVVYSHAPFGQQLIEEPWTRICREVMRCHAVFIRLCKATQKWDLQAIKLL